MLGLRVLNRATLGRQMLLRRQYLPALQVIEHLVAVYRPRHPTRPTSACGRGWRTSTLTSWPA